jgi:hypothetical protein
VARTAAAVTPARASTVAAVSTARYGHGTANDAGGGRWW